MLADAARIEGVLRFTVEVDSGGLDDLLGDVDGLQDQTVTVDVEADTSDVDTLVSDLADIEDESVTLDVEADTEAVDTLAEDLSAIEDEAVEVDVEADTSAVDTLEEDLSGLEDEAVQVDVEADTQAVDDLEQALEDVSDEEITITTAAPDIDARLEEISGKLDTLKKLAIIDFIFNIPENLTALLDRFESLPGISFLIDTDTALAKIEARTGKVIPGLDEVINDIYAETGQNKDTIADVLIELIRQGKTGADTLHDLAQQAMDFEDASGKSALAGQAVADSMVKAGLVDDTTQAYDLLTVAMQTGADKGGDLLGTIQQQAGALKELGFTGEEVVSLIQSGIQAGLPGAGSVVDLIKGMVRTEGNTAADEAITALGLDDEKAAREAGEITGGEYVQAVLDAIKMQPADAQKGFVTALFGARASMIGAGNILGLTVQPDFETGGAAERAATAIDESMGAAFQRAATTLETAVVTALNNALNISGFLQKVEDAANTFATKMQEGATIGEALEIALDIPEGTIARIESAFGNLSIALLEIVANIGEFLGKDVSGIRGTIAQAAETQLAFDLKLTTDPEAISADIATAVERGVSNQGVSNALNMALDEALAGGQTQRAQALFEGISTVLDESQLSDYSEKLLDVGETVDEVIARIRNVQATPGSAGVLGALFPAGVETEIQRLQSGIGTFDLSEAREKLDTAVEDLNQQFDDAIAAHDVGEANRIGELLGMTPGEISEFTQTIKTPIDELTGAVMTGGDIMVDRFGDVSTASVDTSDTVSDSAGLMSDKMADISSTAHEHLTKAKGDFEALATAVTTFMQNAGPQLQNFVNILAGFATTGKNALDVSNAAQGIGQDVANDPANALPPGAESTSANAQHGGVKQGAFWTGETGRELEFSDPRVAILNNQSSEALMSAVRSLMPSTGGGGGRNSYITVNNYFSTQSLAQDASSLQRVANAVRGYGR